MLASAKIPATLEPTGVTRNNGERYDVMIVGPWILGRQNLDIVAWTDSFVRASQEPQKVQIHQVIL